jgi:hypothetical protein
MYIFVSVCISFRGKNQLPGEEEGKEEGVRERGRENWYLFCTG